MHALTLCTQTQYVSVTVFTVVSKTVPEMRLFKQPRRIRKMLKYKKLPNLFLWPLISE